MNRMQSASERRQSGFVLISSMLLLLIITILAVSMFRGFGVQERIAGNLRDKQRATHAAETAQQWAEWWLSSPASSILPANCSAGVLNANLNQSEVQACSNAFPGTLDADSVTTLPWTISGAPVGITYTPPGMNVGNENQPDEYAQSPIFYISYLGSCADLKGTCYQIDAVGYGGGAGTAVSVVESTYEVASGVNNLGGP
ncbi:MAG: pilus assembly PilX family protein [Steroidobacteraceae bacterium]